MESWTEIFAREQGATWESYLHRHAVPNLDYSIWLRQKRLAFCNQFGIKPHYAFYGEPDYYKGIVMAGKENEFATWLQETAKNA